MDLFSSPGLHENDHSSESASHQDISSVPTSISNPLFDTIFPDIGPAPINQLLVADLPAAQPSDVMITTSPEMKRSASMLSDKNGDPYPKKQQHSIDEAELLNY
jgi:hypothetical protein